MKTIVIGGGCFWCIEAVFQRVTGVESVRSGYAGGDMPDPTYHNHGNHAEAVEISYDETIIELGILFDIFFTVHNPTTINRQGNDIGTQYRSVILYGNDEEKQSALDAAERAQEYWDGTIVTEIKKLDTLYEAEDYHQDYYNQNQNNPYCQVVIDPKLAKFREKFAEYLR